MIRRISINSESVRSLGLGVDDEKIDEFDRKAAAQTTNSTCYRK